MALPGIRISHIPPLLSRNSTQALSYLGKYSFMSWIIQHTFPIFTYIKGPRSAVLVILCDSALQNNVCVSFNASPALRTTMWHPSLAKYHLPCYKLFYQCSETIQFTLTHQPQEQSKVNCQLTKLSKSLQNFTIEIYLDYTWYTGLWPSQSQQFVALLCQFQIIMMS